MDKTENIADGVTPTIPPADNEKDSLPINKGIIAEQFLDGKDGVIQYSYYLPENYNEGGAYPMMVVMPGYDMMWFGEESSGTNLNWRGFLTWAELEEDMIVVSAPILQWIVEKKK